MAALTSKSRHVLMTLVSLLLGVIAMFWSKPSFSQTVVSQQQAASVLVIEKLAAQDGVVSGEIHNESNNTVRDLQLFIRYNWLWQDEFHPGKDSPSVAFYPTLSGELAPGKSLSFNFTPEPPLEKRSDGQFETPSVSIAGFASIIQSN